MGLVGLGSCDGRLSSGAGVASGGGVVAGAGVGAACMVCCGGVVSGGEGAGGRVSAGGGDGGADSVSFWKVSGSGTVGAGDDTKGRPGTIRKGNTWGFGTWSNFPSQLQK